MSPRNRKSGVLRGTVSGPSGGTISTADWKRYFTIQQLKQILTAEELMPNLYHPDELKSKDHLLACLRQHVEDDKFEHYLECKKKNSFIPYSVFSPSTTTTTPTSSTSSSSSPQLQDSSVSSPSPCGSASSSRTTRMRGFATTYANSNHSSIVSSSGGGGSSRRSGNSTSPVRRSVSFYDEEERGEEEEWRGKEEAGNNDRRFSENGKESDGEKVMSRRKRRTFAEGEGKKVMMTTMTSSLSKKREGLRSLKNNVLAALEEKNEETEEEEEEEEEETVVEPQKKKKMKGIERGKEKKEEINNELLKTDGVKEMEEQFGSVEKVEEDGKKEKMQKEEETETEKPPSPRRRVTTTRNEKKMIERGRKVLVEEIEKGEEEVGEKKEEVFSTIRRRDDFRDSSYSRERRGLYNRSEQESSGDLSPEPKASKTSEDGSPRNLCLSFPTSSLVSSSLYSPHSDRFSIPSFQWKEESRGEEASMSSGSGCSTLVGWEFETSESDSEIVNMRVNGEGRGSTRTMIEEEEEEVQRLIKDKKLETEKGVILKERQFLSSCLEAEEEKEKEKWIRNDDDEYKKDGEVEVRSRWRMRESSEIIREEDFQERKSNVKDRGISSSRITDDTTVQFSPNTTTTFPPSSSVSSYSYLHHPSSRVSSSSSYPRRFDTDDFSTTPLRQRKSFRQDIFCDPSGVPVPNVSSPSMKDILVKRGSFNPPPLSSSSSSSVSVAASSLMSTPRQNLSSMLISEEEKEKTARHSNSSFSSPSHQSRDVVEDNDSCGGDSSSGGRTKVVATLFSYETRSRRIWKWVSSRKKTILFYLILSLIFCYFVLFPYYITVGLPFCDSGSSSFLSLSSSSYSSSRAAVEEGDEEMLPTPSSECRPCPIMAICKGGKMECITRYVREEGGEGPICVKDKEAYSRAARVTKDIREKLREREGQRLCGYRTTSRMSKEDIMEYAATDMRDKNVKVVVFEEYLTPENSMLHGIIVKHFGFFDDSSGSSSSSSSPFPHSSSSIIGYEYAGSHPLKPRLCLIKEFGVRHLWSIGGVLSLWILIWLMWSYRRRESVCNHLLLQIITSMSRPDPHSRLTSGPTVKEILETIKRRKDISQSYKSYLTIQRIRLMCEALDRTDSTVHYETPYIGEPFYWSELGHTGEATAAAATTTARSPRRGSEAIPSNCYDDHQTNFFVLLRRIGVALIGWINNSRERRRAAVRMKENDERESWRRLSNSRTPVVLREEKGGGRGGDMGGDGLLIETNMRSRLGRGNVVVENICGEEGGGEKRTTRGGRGGGGEAEGTTGRQIREENVEEKLCEEDYQHFTLC